VKRQVGRLRSDDGQALVEYSLILFLVALVAVGALSALGQAMPGIFQSVIDGF
jgi:Flp pilus assembly pilin Flp